MHLKRQSPKLADGSVHSVSGCVVGARRALIRSSSASTCLVLLFPLETDLKPYIEKVPIGSIVVFFDYRIGSEI